MKSDARIDAYVERSASFAKPILSHLPTLVAEHCPKGEESIKSQSPGIRHHDGILCGMATVNARATFVLWPGKRRTGETSDRCKRLETIITRREDYKRLPGKHERC